MSNRVVKMPVPYWYSAQHEKELHARNSDEVERLEGIATNAAPEVVTNSYLTPEGDVVSVELDAAKPQETVEQFMPETAYFAGHRVENGEWVENDRTVSAPGERGTVDTQSPSTPRDTTGRLSAAEISALENERSSLVRAMPNLTGGAWSKADHRLKVIEEQLRRARSNEHADRAKGDRAAERPRQAGTMQSLQEHLDKTLLQQAREFMRDVHRETANSNSVCCVGEYLCTKCKAAKAGMAH